MLAKEAAAVAFVHDAFAHLKVIGHTAAAKPLMDKAGVVADAGVVAVDGHGGAAFLDDGRPRAGSGTGSRRADSVLASRRRCWQLRHSLRLPARLGADKHRRPYAWHGLSGGRPASQDAGHWTRPQRPR